MRTNTIGLIVLAASLTAANAASGQDATAKANRMAYESATRCFLANGYAGDERRKAGDKSKEAAYLTKARQSYDVAFAAGRKLGISDQEIGRDIDFAQTIELPRFIRDGKYLLGVASTCKALGLM